MKGRRCAWRAVVVVVALMTAAASRSSGQGDPTATPRRDGVEPPPWSTSPAVGLGPLGQGSGSPLSVFRLVQPPPAPSTLGQGQWELSAHADWGNYFCDGGDRYLLDYESLRLRLGVAYGLTARTQVALGSVVSYQGGGILDGFIEWFERSVGASNPDRLAAPRDRYLIRARKPDGSTQEWGGDEAGWHADSVALGVKHRLLEGSESAPALVATAVLKLPGRSGVPGRPAGGVDVGASLALGQRLGRFNLYGSLGAVLFGKSETDGVELFDSQLSLMAGVEYRSTPRTSLLAQLMVSTPVAHHFGALSDRTREGAVGLKHRIGDQLLLEISVGENLLVFANSADVVFRAGLSWRS